MYQLGSKRVGKGIESSWYKGLDFLFSRKRSVQSLDLLPYMWKRSSLISSLQGAKVFFPKVIYSPITVRSLKGPIIAVSWYHIEKEKLLSFHLHYNETSGIPLWGSRIESPNH